MSKQEIIETLKKAISALEGLDAPSTRPAASKPVERRPAVVPATQDERRSFRSGVVVGWKVGETQTGRSWGALTLSSGGEEERFPCFDPAVLGAVDPLFNGDEVQVFLKPFTQRDGTEALKIVKIDIVKRAPGAKIAEDDPADDIPF